MIVEVNHIRCEVVPDGEQVGMKCTGETESTLKMSAVNIVGLFVRRSLEVLNHLNGEHY